MSIKNKNNSNKKRLVIASSIVAIGGLVGIGYLYWKKYYQNKFDPMPPSLYIRIDKQSPTKQQNKNTVLSIISPKEKQEEQQESYTQILYVTNPKILKGKQEVTQKYQRCSMEKNKQETKKQQTFLDSIQNLKQQVVRKSVDNIVINNDKDKEQKRTKLFLPGGKMYGADTYSDFAKY